MKAIEITEPGKIRIIEKEMPAPAENEALLIVGLLDFEGALEIARARVSPRLLLFADQIFLESLAHQITSFLVTSTMQKSSPSLWRSVFLPIRTQL